MSIDIYEVTKKLIGEIEPVGETRTDDVRFENLKVMITLVDKLLSEIDAVAANKTQHEFSMKRAGEHASDFFNDIGIIE